MLPELRIYTTPDDIKYLLFEQNEVISDEIRNNGIWNGACLDLAEKVLAKGHSGRVIDIGAGFGSFTLPLALKHLLLLISSVIWMVLPFNQLALMKLLMLCYVAAMTRIMKFLFKCSRLLVVVSLMTPLCLLLV